MNTNEKVGILYKKVRGENLSFQEKSAVSKYNVSREDGAFLATKKNLRDYIKAVDSGATRKNFYTWCIDNGRADARRKGGKASDIKEFRKEQGLGAFLMGFLVWGIAVYWILGGRASVGASAIVGGIISFVLYKINRKITFFTCLVLPIMLAAYFSGGF